MYTCVSCVDVGPSKCVLYTKAPPSVYIYTSVKHYDRRLCTRQYCATEKASTLSVLRSAYSGRTTSGVSHCQGEQEGLSLVGHTSRCPGHPCFVVLNEENRVYCIQSGGN